MCAFFDGNLLVKLWWIDGGLMVDCWWIAGFWIVVFRP
jgi:hypothetical protein